MTFIAWPGLRIGKIAWSPARPGNALVSPYTGNGPVITNPWHARRSAAVTLAPIVGEAGIRSYRSFIGQMKGRNNVTRLPATESAQNANSGVKLSAAAAAGATSISITGAATPLLDGQLATINGQVVQLTADQAGAVLTFEPPLRAAAAINTTVVTSRPYMLASLTSSANGWSASQGTLYNAGFGMDEAVLEADGSPVPEA